MTLERGMNEYVLDPGNQPLALGKRWLRSLRRRHLVRPHALPDFFPARRPGHRFRRLNRLQVELAADFFRVMTPKTVGAEKRAYFAIKACRQICRQLGRILCAY